jgi:hypothetical protein
MHPFFADYCERFDTLLTGFEHTIDGLTIEALDRVPGPDTNSLCVLVIHTTGAARYWVGDVALGEPSGRDRDAEFESYGLSEAELKVRLRDCVDYIRTGVARLTPVDLPESRPAPGREQTFTVGWALLHALEHASLHLGHAQLTRQLLDGRSG